VTVPSETPNLHTIRVVQTSHTVHSLDNNIDSNTNSHMTDNNNNQIVPSHRATSSRIPNYTTVITESIPENDEQQDDQSVQIPITFGRSITRSRTIYSTSSAISTTVPSVPTSPAPRSPPIPEPQLSGLQAFTRPSSQDLPHPQADDHGKQEASPYIGANHSWSGSEHSYLAHSPCSQ